MKCPKCGFTSFDFLENCKKCGSDLQDHKSKFGLRSLIFPGFQSTEPAPSLIDENAEEFADAAGADSGDFGFDFMSDDEQPAEEEDLGGDSELADSLVDTDDSAVFADDPFSTDAEGDEDGVWSPEEDTAVTAERTAEVAAEELLEVEEEVEFDNWESDSDEDLNKPPAQEEDPSDPFDYREPAEEMQVPETPIPENEQNTCPQAEELFDPEPMSGAAAALAGEEVQAAFLPDSDQSDAFAIDPAEEPFSFDDGDAGPDPAVAENQRFAGQTTEQAPEAVQSGLFPTDEPELEDEPERFTLDAGSEDRAGAAEQPLPDHTEEDLFADTASAAFGPDNLEEGVPIPALSARISACLTDLLILAAIFSLFLVVGEMTVPDPQGQRLLPSPATLLDMAVPYFLVLFALCFGYFTLFHFLTGQTPGKMLLRLRVESITGEPLLFSQAFLRSSGGLFSVLAVGVGYLVAAFNKHGRGWNDLLAGSRLVPLDAEEFDEDDLAPFES